MFDQDLTPRCHWSDGGFQWGNYPKTTFSFFQLGELVFFIQMNVVVFILGRSTMINMVVHVTRNPEKNRRTVDFQGVNKSCLTPIISIGFLLFYLFGFAIEHACDHVICEKAKSGVRIC